MTAPAIETISDIEIQLLNDLNFDHTPKCDNDVCDNDASHLIRCHCSVGTEYSCLSCIDNMKEAGKNNPMDGGILFDPNKSCGHFSLIFICTITPI